jgi:cytochrome c peroxidase
VGIAVDEASGRALVWSEFSHSLTWVALVGTGSFEIAGEPLPRKAPLPAAFEKGRVLFHTADTRISEDARACASCHPDGRDDGLVWSTPDGPRNPPMLAGRLDRTGPYGWLGTSATVAEHLKKTFKRLGGKGLEGDDRDALIAYLQQMHAPPVRAAGTDSDGSLAEEGELLFQSEKVGCSSCHGDRGDAPDTLTHNVRSRAHRDVQGLFDTPSLRFIGGTAPYFHDGRYKSLHSLLSHTRHTMGSTAQLSPHELLALETYLGTL